MRAVVVACIVVFAWNASAKQVEAELGMSSVTGLFVGNVSDGTLWMGSPLKIRVDWAAFIEEDRSKRWRLGVEVPLNESVALGLRPGVDIPLNIVGQPFILGLGLRSYVTPFTLHGAEVEVAWTPRLLGIIKLMAGGSVSAFFFGNDLPTNNGALVEFQGLLGVRLPL